MGWEKSWILFISLCVLLSPINLEAKANFRKMNLLESVETKSAQDKLIIKLNFKEALQGYNQPVFYKKSIQVDFPNAYSDPAKKFLTTDNDQISQIYVSQFDSEKMRVRFIFGKNAEKSFENRFHLKKKDKSLIVQIDLNQVDLLDQLLARATATIKEKKQTQLTNKISKNLQNEKILKEPIHSIVKNGMINDTGSFKDDLPEKIVTASFNKNPQWKETKETPESILKPVKKASFNFLNSGSNKETGPTGLVSSGFKMVMTLSLVLGLIFLLFFGFKKYVLKNTVFGGGEKLIQVVSTNYLAPKKNISLVEVAGEILVLGISDQNISLLTSIREPERIEEIKKTHGGNTKSTIWQQKVPVDVAGKVSLATSNAKNVFSKYLEEFSDPESNKQASVATVTEKIRRQMGKVRLT